MKKSWMGTNRTNKSYVDGVAAFIDYTVNNLQKMGNINLRVNKQHLLMPYPCTKCLNHIEHKVEEVKFHLFRNGIDLSYTNWTRHGEKDEPSISAPKPVNDTTEFVDDTDFASDIPTDGPATVEIVNATKDNFDEDDLVKFPELLLDAEKPLYEGCLDFIKLSTIVKLLNLKGKYGASDKFFTELLGLIKKMLPVGNEMVEKTYQAKKVMKLIGSGYKKIHVCINNCLLYWKDDKDLTAYPRNLRLGISADGVDVNTGNRHHSVWPVLTVIYNLPPWLCMKRKFIMLSVLISGYPGNDIDVFLEPLVDDLHTLFETGVDTYDVSTKDNFNLRAVVLWTINDYPALGTLCGCPYSGFKGCVVCGKDTNCVRLSASSKQSYVGHRRYLPYNHPFRKQKKAFNGQQEFLQAPIPMTGEQIYNEVKHIENKWGKGKRTNNNASENQEDTRGRGGKIQKQKRNTTEEEGSSSQVNGQNGVYWKKFNIWYRKLKYWRHNPVPHCIDFMHVEKNVAESIVGTLLHVPGKTKDGLNARLDLAELGVKPELFAMQDEDKTTLPPAGYTLTNAEKDIFCETLHNIKVPEGYCSNFSSLVNLKDRKLIGLKSHDYHMLMQEFLPIAIRSIMHPPTRYAIIRFCFFFKSICSKEIILQELDKMQAELVVTLCLLEKFFPPSFFDIMIHLTVHLTREVKLCGPICFRWMYPFERCMKVIKGHVRNRNKPEGCIAEETIAEEFLANIINPWKLLVERELAISKESVSETVRAGGVKRDNLGYTLVDLNNLGHKVDPFILASQARQVFYVKDQIDKKLSIVFKTPPKNYKDMYDEVDEEFSTVIHQHNDNILPCVNRRDLEIIVVNLDSSSDNNNSDSYSTSQISTSEEIDYDSPEPPKSLLKWYHYLSDEYKDNGRFWGSKSGCNESDVKPSWKDIEKAKACMLAKAQASEASSKAKVEACGSKAKVEACGSKAKLQASTKTLIADSSDDSKGVSSKGPSITSIPKEGPSIARLSKEPIPKELLAWYGYDIVEDDLPVAEKPILKVIFKSPIPIKRCVLGLANVETWDNIVKKYGMRTPGRCADKSKGKRKVLSCTLHLQLAYAHCICTLHLQLAFASKHLHIAFADCICTLHLYIAFASKHLHIALAHCICSLKGITWVGCCWSVWACGGTSTVSPPDWGVSGLLQVSSIRMSPLNA
ncbi:putative transposon, En/Spm-like protein [Tanacetum coccineum]